MISDNVVQGITQAFEYLKQVNSKNCEYWHGVLYNTEGHRITENWHTNSLEDINKDVYNAKHTYALDGYNALRTSNSK